MQFRKFLVATTLGIAPQTLIYSYLGYRAPNPDGRFASGSVSSGYREQRGRYTQDLLLG